MKRRYCHSVILTLALALLGLVSAGADANRIQLGGATLEFNVPEEVRAYRHLPVDCKITGSGDVIVQAVATDCAAHARFYDSAIPRKLAYRIDYLSEQGNSARFRVTNTGNTVWKTTGQGSATFADISRPYVFFPHDMAPGDSVVKTFPINVLRPEGGAESSRRFVLSVSRDDTRRLPERRTRVELIVDDCKPGWSGSAEVVMNATPTLDEFDEFGHAYFRRQLNQGESYETKLKVLVPPWADRLVVRLIKQGAMRAVSIPIKPSRETMKLRGNPDNRWTLKGKPIFVLDALPRMPIDQMPHLREQFGGDNIVLVCEAETNPDSDWLNAVREHGFKIMPVSIGYVRLQRIGQIAGYELMEGGPAEFNIQRVDALDPNFHVAMADVVDMVLEAAGDVLYGTADGKIPITLSEEQSYGFPFGAGHPIRWGGTSSANVAAFREWLREKYGTIDRLNKAWKYDYKSFDEIDPSPLASLPTNEYPDPWKEWGPGIEDFDIFRSKIHGEFWSRTVAEIKRRHPNVLLGLNLYAAFASEHEPIYNGFFEWGVTDYAGKPVNWMARRAGVLPDDLDCLDFLVCWNTGSPEAAKRNIEFWGSRGKDVVIYARGYPKVVPGGNYDLRSHLPLNLNKNGIMIHQAASFFTTLQTVYEMGGIPGTLNDSYIGGRLNETERREIQLFNKEVMRASEAN